MNKRNDSELVLGLISTVGTDVDSAIKYISEHLYKFEYATEVIHVSKDIMSKFVVSQPPRLEAERIEYYMDLGNRLREKSKDSSILMKAVCEYIYKKRSDMGEPSPRGRVAYVIKSIKHPEEVEFLRNTYGDGFHLIGLTSSYNIRLSNLTSQKGITKDKAEHLLERDSNEEMGHGQHTQDAFQQADYFIDIGNETDRIRKSVARLLDLLFGDPFISPCFDEYAMFMAYVTSLRSADLSRQVGAAIARENEIIAMGTNDCPKVGGGLYWPIAKNGGYEDIEGGRDYKLGYDSNKKEQKIIIEEIFKKFDIDNTDDNIVKIKETGIGDLTEFGRVVHAEMDSLLMCARNNISCKGATIYVTTFPCHNCAKHIIAAGIERVVYIEPYPKSKALRFYQNEISSTYNQNKVSFIPFVGVGPQKFIDLFAVRSMKSYNKIRKNKQGDVIPWQEETASLRNPMSRFTYIDYEKAAVKYVNEQRLVLKEEADKYGVPSEVCKGNTKIKARVKRTGRIVCKSEDRN